MSLHSQRERLSRLFDMRPLNACMLQGSPPKIFHGPPFRDGRNSPIFFQSKALNWRSWAWCLLVPLLVQMQLVFAADPAQAIDFVLSKYDHALSPGDHGHTQFGRGQDHGHFKHVDVLQEGDTAEKNLDASAKKLFTSDSTLSQSGLRFKVINERTVPNRDSVNVLNELVGHRKKLNHDVSSDVLSKDVRETREGTREESGEMNQSFTVTVNPDVSGKTKASLMQEKKLAEKVSEAVTEARTGAEKTSRKVKKAGNRSRPRRGVEGLPNPPLPMSMPGLILAHGYPAEVHHVRTEDGYILEVHRIPGPRVLDTSPKKRRRNLRRVGRGRRDTAQSNELNDILVALERERIDNWLQNENLGILLPHNDIVDEMVGLHNLRVPETVVRENYEYDEDNPGLLDGNDVFVSETSEKLSRSKRSEHQQNMMKRRQMIQTLHPRVLLNMARRGRAFDARVRRRPQTSIYNPHRSQRRSYQRPRRRSHTPLNHRRNMRDRTNVLPRPNSFNLSSEKSPRKQPSSTGITSDRCQVPGKCCNNFTAKCPHDNLNFDATRPARQIVPIRNSKLNENNLALSESDLINGELNEIDSENLRKNSSSSEYHSKSKKPGRQAKKVVFIQHCLQCSSADFVLNDHNQALAFILADEGYDVWLGNFRGNQYSRGHVSLSPRSIKYWQFTVDDLARYDLPAMVNHVLSKTQADDLFYIGHSLGTMTFFMASSTNADFLSKIRLMVALAPSGYIDHMSGGLKLMVKGAQTFYGLMETIGIGEIGTVMPWRGGLMSRFCKPESPLAGLCSAFLPAMSGSNNGLHDMEYLPSMLSNLPAGTSFRLMAQIGQIIGANGIRKFDYGVEENLRHYGTRTPPHYKLEKITCPVAIMWSQNDIIVQPVDVAKTVRRLPNVVMNYKVPHSTFNHVDFLFADVARELVYEPIVKLFASYA